MTYLNTVLTDVYNDLYIVNTKDRYLLTTGHIFVEIHCMLGVDVTKRRPTTVRVKLLIRLKQDGIADNAGE